MKNKIFTGFLIYGIAAGLFFAWSWPGEGIHILLNMPGMLLGDGIYINSINYLGDPSSGQAHYTIPWILRIPQVYVPASILSFGITGLIIQLIKNIREKKN